GESTTRWFSLSWSSRMRRGSVIPLSSRWRWPRRRSRGFLNGQGLNEPVLERALVLEDPELGMPIMFRPTLIAGLLRMWTGSLEQAREIFYQLRRDCLERGEETDLMFVAFHTVLLECWRGDLDAPRPSPTAP